MFSGNQLASMGYYFNKSLDEREIYRRLASRPSARKKFSKFRGVQKSCSPTHPYRVCLTYQGRQYHIGNFADEIEAAKAYNNFCIKLFGDYAILNILDDEDTKDNQAETKEIENDVKR